MNYSSVGAERSTVLRFRNENRARDAWRIGIVTEPGRVALRNVDDPLEAARTVLGALLTVGTVRARIVEVEAYGGDPAGPWPTRPRIRTGAGHRVTR